MTAIWRNKRINIPIQCISDTKKDLYAFTSNEHQVLCVGGIIVTADSRPDREDSVKESHAVSTTTKAKRTGNAAVYDVRITVRFASSYLHWTSHHRF